MWSWNVAAGRFSEASVLRQRRSCFCLNDCDDTKRDVVFFRFIFSVLFLNMVNLCWQLCQTVEGAVQRDHVWGELYLDSCWNKPPKEPHRVDRYLLCLFVSLGDLKRKNKTHDHGISGKVMKIVFQAWKWFRNNNVSEKFWMHVILYYWKSVYKNPKMCFMKYNPRTCHVKSCVASWEFTSIMEYTGQDHRQGHAPFCFTDPLGRGKSNGTWQRSVY